MFEAMPQDLHIGPANCWMADILISNISQFKPSLLQTLQAKEALAEAKRELVRVFEAMPRDLQQTMLSAPHRATLLHGLRAHTKVNDDNKHQRYNNILKTKQTMLSAPYQEALLHGLRAHTKL